MNNTGQIIINANFTLLLLLVIGTGMPAAAQVSIPITEEIQRRNGQDYFIHTVQKGQTYFSIAKAYHITLERLREENPASGDVLLAGTVLRIPVTSRNMHLRSDRSRTDTTHTGSDRSGSGRAHPPRTEPGTELQEGQLTVLEAMYMEQRLDDIISRALNNYFDASTYLLEVSVDFSSRAYRREVQVPVIRERQRELDGQLPGVPFMPPQFLRDLGVLRSVEEERTQTRITRVPEIDRMEIIIRADSSYEKEELALMQQIVEAKVQLEPDRGDIFEIRQQRFALNDTETGVAEVPSADRYFYLLLAGIVLLALFLGVLAWYLLVILPRRNVETGLVAPSVYSTHGTAALSAPPNVQGTRDDANMLAGYGGEDTSINVPPKKYLMQIFMRQPEQIGRLFTAWYENDQDTEMRRAASIIQSIDPKILGLLRDSMTPEAFRSLEEALRSPHMAPSMRKDVLLQQFAEQLQIRQQQTGGSEGFSVLPSFDFLQYTDDDELYEILNSENERVKALVLSHLPDFRKGKLLQAFGLEEASRIIFCLPQVRTIPFHEYEKVASRLFERRYDFTSSTHSVTEKDIDYIVSVIETLPVSDQDKYIRQLDHLASDLADAVRDRVITMDRITELDNETLEQAVDALNREELAALLVGTEESLRTRLLQFRPKREEEQIREEIENLVFLSRDEIDRSRNKLLTLLRQILNSKKSASSLSFLMY